MPGSGTGLVGLVENLQWKPGTPNELQRKGTYFTTGSHGSQDAPWVVNSLRLPGFHKCQKGKTAFLRHSTWGWQEEPRGPFLMSRAGQDSRHGAGIVR